MIVLLSPKKFVTTLQKAAHCDIEVFERALGFDAGYFIEHGGMVRVDVTDIGGLNLRVLSGNET